MATQETQFVHDSFTISSDLLPDNVSDCGKNFVWKFSCCLSFGGRKMVFPYTMGRGHSLEHPTSIPGFSKESHSWPFRPNLYARLGWKKMKQNSLLNRFMTDFSTPGTGAKKLVDPGFREQCRRLAYVLKPIEPTVKGVLYSLAMDFEAGYSSFEDFASEYGFDTDSISALKVYEAVCKQAREFLKLCGSENVVKMVCEESRLMDDMYKDTREVQLAALAELRHPGSKMSAAVAADFGL